MRTETTTTTKPLVINPDDHADYTGQKLWRVEALYSSEPAYVFATDMQEALGIVVDESDYLDHLKVEIEWEELGQDYDPSGDGLSPLGNASDYFEIDNIVCREVCDAPTPADLVSAWIATVPNK